MTGSDNPEDRFADALVDFLANVPLLRSVEPTSPAEVQLWRACELCIYLGYRHEVCPDPRALSGDAIADWRRRGLVPGRGPERPGRYGAGPPLLADARRRARRNRRAPEWEQRHRWGDVGLPEGLAYKIGIFEAYARHLGLRFDTPRIPGLVYPGWQYLQ